MFKKRIYIRHHTEYSEYRVFYPHFFPSVSRRNLHSVYYICTNCNIIQAFFNSFSYPFLILFFHGLSCATSFLSSSRAWRMSETEKKEAYMLRQQPHPLKSQKDTALFCANRISGAKQCQLGPTQIMPTWIHPNNANLDLPKQCQYELSQLEQKKT